jgi:hypothetical protein
MDARVGDKPRLGSADAIGIGSKSGRSLAFAGKYAKKFGLCQWVIPGITIRSMSAIQASKGSPCAGGSTGRSERMEPGVA